MFGINGLKERMSELMDIVALLVDQVGDNTKALSSFADRGASIVKYEIDAKSDLSAIRHQMQTIEREMSHVRATTEKYEDILDGFLETRFEKDEAMKQILVEFIEKQNLLFEFVESLEELLETTETIMEELKPEKKIPKLPKSTTATTEIGQ